MKMKEKVETILGGFLERNKDYAIGVYVRNGKAGNIIVYSLIPINRNIILGEKQCSMSANAGNMRYCNNISLPYDVILDCYEEKDEYNSQTVHVIMKNGMMFEFECVGLRV